MRSDQEGELTFPVAIVRQYSHLSRSSRLMKQVLTVSTSISNNYLWRTRNVGNSILLFGLRDSFAFPIKGELGLLLWLST